jgi:NADPH-dependent 2,4-dienoyl-CoA reductase/sulfur reductase-like enzyme
LLLPVDGRVFRLTTIKSFISALADAAGWRGLRKASFAVIGSGFIGSEIAAALTMTGKKVTMIFPGHNIGDRLFPRDLARYVSGVYREKGVELVPGEKIIASEASGDQRMLKTASGKTIVVDAVVAGIGIEPNIELAEAIGLTTENGIVVDEFLRTSNPNIHAAETWPHSTTRHWENGCGLSTRTTPTRWDGWPAGT